MAGTPGHRGWIMLLELSESRTHITGNRCDRAQGLGRRVGIVILPHDLNTGIILAVGLMVAVAAMILGVVMVLRIGMVGTGTLRVQLGRAVVIQHAGQT